MQHLVTILTDHDQLELLEEFLNLSQYIFSVELFPGTTKNDTSINIYCVDEVVQNDVFDIVSSFIVKNEKQGLISLSKGTLEDKDWQESWKKHFIPIVAGRLVVGISEEDIAKIDKVKVIIDPGMAFGNGSHPTTKGCLILIDRYLEAGMKVLDFGSGSGVLAIACDKLGADLIDAMDNDTVAVEACKRNVKHNDSKVKVYTSEEFEIRKDYNFVIANITVDIIIQFFKYFTEGQQSLKYVLLSGISDYRKSQMDIFLNTEGIMPTDVYEDDGWYTYLLTCNKTGGII